MELTDAATIISEELLKDLAVDYSGSPIVFLRSLRTFIAKNREFVEKNEEYQLKLLKFLHSEGAKLGPRKKRAKRGIKRPVNSDMPVEKTATEISEGKEIEHQNLYSQVVLEMLLCELSRRTYVRLLLHIHDRIMPSMTKPLLLADFLVTSFRRGGLISILALNGLFTLVQEYNLDFPQFYENFYGLLTPEVLNAKYRARFFYLADLFMSSSHVPQYTVAAVAKRLSRLSSTAPADSLPLVLTFTLNLIIRHPLLTGLVHRVSDMNDIITDPFVESEPDMRKCSALDSSLWELKSLSSHYNEEVVEFASYLDDKPPATEFDITEHLETDTQEMIEQVLQSDSGKSASLTEIPKVTAASAALFSLKSPCFGDLWTIS